MTHPLTDDIAENIASTEFQSPFGIGELVFTYNDMRSAADWQLEQVIEWLRENLYYIQEDGLVRYVYGDDFATIASHEVITDIKKAMRPQEDNS